MLPLSSEADYPVVNPIRRGALQFNDTSGNPEFWDGSIWKLIGSGESTTAGGALYDDTL